MPSQAYVLIEGAAGSIPGIQKALRKTEGVKACDAVAGQFDLIALVEADDSNQLGRISYSTIQMLEGVVRTVTCNIIEVDSK